MSQREVCISYHGNTNDAINIRGVARGYLHDPSQDRENELDSSFKRSDPLHNKILIV